MSDILSNGVWTGSKEHDFDPFLSDAVLEFCEGESRRTVVDFGCGSAQIAHNLVTHGISCEAYDGNPNTPQMTQNLGKVLELSVPFDLGRKFDLVISFEVGEHIPKQFEQIFIDNLVKHAEDTILISWAVVGQSGHGHVNCQNNPYVIAEFAKRGFEFDEFASKWFRQSAKKLAWFRNTIMLFRRSEPE